MVALNPVYFAIFFFVLWIVINIVVSRLTGWARIAAHYPTVGGYTGKVWRFQTITSRRGMGYKGNVTVGADSRGIYLSMFFLFRFGHRPLFVPWGDINITEKQKFRSKLLELRFRKTEDISLRIFAKLGDRLAEAAGSNWPGVGTGGGNDTYRRVSVTEYRRKTYVYPVNNIYSRLLAIFIGSLLLTMPGPNVALAGEMAKHVPKVIEVEREKRAFTFDTGTMSQTEAEGVAGYFHNKYGDDETVTVYKIPGSDDYYLVSGSMGHQEESDYGIRFSLVRKEGDSHKQLFRGRGAGDSYNLDPVFYSSKDRVLIIAESGAEYSWGLSAYEFREGKLKALGYLTVARWSGENYVDPLDKAQIFLRDGRYAVEFATNLRLNPGGLHPWWLVRVKEKITFVQDGDKFILSGDSVGNQVCFYFLGQPVTDDDNEILSDLDHYYNQLIPWWEKNRISHSFQMDLPLQMIPSDGKEVVVEKDELPMSVGIILMDRKGRRKILEGVYTDVDLISEMKEWLVNSSDR